MIERLADRWDIPSRDMRRVQLALIALWAVPGLAVTYAVWALWGETGLLLWLAFCTIYNIVVGHLSAFVGASSTEIEGKEEA